jgi:hypothetical protein
LDWTSRQLRRDKRGAIPSDVAPIVQRLHTTGDDLLTAGPGRDILLEEASNDQLRVQDDRDVLIGGTGKDQLKGSAQNRPRRSPDRRYSRRTELARNQFPILTDVTFAHVSWSGAVAIWPEGAATSQPRAE